MHHTHYQLYTNQLKPLLHSSSGFLLTSLLIILSWALNILNAESIIKTPSENAGKTGMYQVETEFPGNNYYIYVPSTYNENNPAGLHIYFHGQNGQKGANWFGPWKNNFCERFNLIGINMQYMDGDNGKKLGTKVLAARHAIAQTLADYKIISGRGIICCFSGGGLPSGELYSQFAAQGGDNFPFNHMALYSANYRTTIQQDKRPMSWSISVGENEWNLAALGQTQSARFFELCRQSSHHQDFYYNIVKGGKHKIHKNALNSSADIFYRNDIASSPLLYAADYAEKDLAKLVLASNKLAFGVARKEIDKLLKKKDLDAALKDKVKNIETAIQTRITAMTELLTTLAAEDPALCAFYAKGITNSLKKWDKELDKNIKNIIKNIDKDLQKKSLKAAAALYKMAPSLFGAKGHPKAEMQDQLRMLSEGLHENDQSGSMMREYLMLVE